MRFKQYLTEKSYTSKDIPKNFKVVIDLTLNTIKELNQMELKGIKGISSSGEIIFDFLGVGRNAFLVMNSKKVIELNKLSRFMYDNPHYFYSNNMTALKRMYQKSITDNRGTWHNISDYLFKEFNRMGIVNSYDVSANAPGQKISYTNVVKNSKVNSIKDAVKVFRKAMKEILQEKNAHYYSFFEDILKMSNKELEKVFINSFKKDIGSVYQDEGEWVVKNTSLKIPNKSYLYVLMHFTESDIKNFKENKWDGFELMRYEDKIKEEILLRNSLEKIENKYIIKYISNKKWDEIRTKHFTKKYEH
jgi:hypothetical protein